jgi:hypothetical protein
VSVVKKTSQASHLWKHAILDEESKSHALAIWDARWKTYIDDIVSSGGGL